MKKITLHKQWIIRAHIDDVFKIITNFEKFPEYFPKVAESIQIKKQNGNFLEMDAVVKSFGKKFPIKMRTEILPRKGFVSNNDNPKFGTSGHEEFLLFEHPNGTLVDYTYQIIIYKKWLRIIATPLIRWYSMKYWEKSFIDELRNILEK